MSGAVGLAGRLRRVREVGAVGLARRLRLRVQAPARARASARWLERYAEPASEPALSAALAAPGAGSGGLAALRERIAPGARFFLDPADTNLCRTFAARHPAARVRVLEEADAACRGDLSWVVPGGTSDWNAALPGGGRWPRAAASETGYDADRPRGDVRLAFEVGRSTHLVRLAQAAWLSGEPRHARAVLDGFRGFAAECPPGTGIAWAHAQEAALRAVAWLWAFQLVRPSGLVDDGAFRTWLWLMLAHGEFVATHLSDQPVTHNHAVSEAAGLALLGLALPELRAAGRWRRLGLRVLARELARQVDGEGAHGERSTHYHAFVLDSCVAVLLLARRAGAELPPAIGARAAAMAGFVAWMIRADGTLPPIGDTDAGRACRLGGDPLDRRDLLAAAAVLFGRADWGAIAGDAPGAFWLAGGAAIPGAGGARPPGGARRFAAAGLAVARTGHGDDAEVAVFRAGPTRFLPDVLLSHTHADACSVLLRVGADDVLVDPGTYLYSEREGWRAWLRGTPAHSCVVVDGRDQADVRSLRFGISGLRPARWRSFAGDADHLAAAAEHPAGGATLRRRVAWARGGLLALCDDVLGDGEHAVEAWLQLPATTGAASGAGARLRLASGRALRVQVFGPVRALTVHRPKPGDGPGPGWLAPRYGTLAPGTALRVDAGRVRLPLRLLTVVQVGDAAGEPTPACVESDRAGWRVTADGRRLVFEGGDGVRVERAAPAAAGAR